MSPHTDVFASVTPHNNKPTQKESSSSTIIIPSLFNNRGQIESKDGNEATKEDKEEEGKRRIQDLLEAKDTDDNDVVGP